MPKKSLRFLRIAVTAALFVYVLHSAGLFRAEGWQELFTTLKNTHLGWLLASFGVALLLSFSSAVKWYMLLQARGIAVGLWRIYAYYMVGRFFNLVLPSSVGGDFIRVHELGKYTGRQADAAASVFVERFSGLITLVTLAMMAVGINLKLFNLPWLTAALGSGGVIVAFICWLIIDERPFKLIQKLLGNRVRLLDGVLTKIGKLRQAVLSYQDIPSALWIAFINSLIFNLLAVINIWVSTVAFGVKFAFVKALVATPVILFIMNLPFSIGGLGLMEFAYSFTLGLFGVPATVAFSVALLMRIKTFIDAAIGSTVYPLVSSDRSIPEQAPHNLGN